MIRSSLDRFRNWRWCFVCTQFWLHFDLQSDCILICIVFYPLRVGVWPRHSLSGGIRGDIEREPRPGQGCRGQIQCEAFPQTHIYRKGDLRQRLKKEGEGGGVVTFVKGGCIFPNDKMVRVFPSALFHYSLLGGKLKLACHLFCPVNKNRF